MLGLTSMVPVAVVMLAISSLAWAVWNVVSVSLRESVVPDRLLGRVSSAYRTLAAGAAPAGALAGGALATVFGLRVPFLAGAPLLFAAALLALRTLNPATIAAARAARD